jgi:hypothetical protein
MGKILFLGFLALVLINPVRVSAQNVSIDTLPSSVVRTVPQCGDKRVDASATKQIEVTFSKEMLDKSWSWVQISNETFPKLIGAPHYLADKKTCVLDVKLEPGKTYAIWANSEKLGDFKDTGNRSAIPYLLVFQTK